MNPEVERFLGWITMNCSPKVVDITFLGTSLTKPGVMVHNVDAKNFIKKILGDHLDIQYDNCVIWAGDLNGFTGNNEGKKICNIHRIPKDNAFRLPQLRCRQNV